VKVLHVVSYLSRSSGGIASVVVGLANAQKSLGHEVAICTTDRDYPPASCLSVEVLSRDLMKGVVLETFSVEHPAILFSHSMRLWLRANMDEYDLVHVHGLYRFPVTYAATLARKRSVPYVVTPHGSLDPYVYRQSSKSVFLKRLYEKFFDWPNLNDKGAIHYTSADEQQLSSFFDFSAPSFVVPNGLAWSEYEHLPARGGLRKRFAADDSPIVLFLGRINFKKGLDILIPAMVDVLEMIPSARLWLVGPEADDDYGQKVRGWVRDYGIQGNVDWIGSLYGRDVVQAYVDSDVFVLPSYTENFGMTVAEAMASGVPVVISNKVNIHAEVEASGSGIVTNCDSTEVGQALMALLQDPGRRAVMGRSGRSYVHKHWTWDSVSRSMISNYQKVIDSFVRS